MAKPVASSVTSEAAVSTQPIAAKLKNRDYFKEKVDHLAADSKESSAKWYKDNPGRTPGWNPTHTWKTFSSQRHPSPAYRKNYDLIQWGTDGKANQ